MKITLELQTETKLVSSDGVPPLKGTHMLVCRNRWFNASFGFRPFYGRRPFCIFPLSDYTKCCIEGGGEND
jgi:hypothetical protein